MRERTIEVTAPKDRRRDGLKIYVAELPPDEMAVRDGIPTTTAARTILDLAAVDRPLTVERALHDAERLRLADTTPLTSLLARYPRRPGTPAIKRILGQQAVGQDITDSELENAFLALLDRNHLPRPLINRWLQVGTDWIRADALYPEQRLIVELDGRGAHETARAFHADRRRDRRLLALGWHVIRLTWRDIHHDEPGVVEDLTTLLDR